MVVAQREHKQSISVEEIDPSRHVTVVRNSKRFKKRTKDGDGRLDPLTIPFKRKRPLITQGAQPANARMRPNVVLQVSPYVNGSFMLPWEQII